MALRFSSIGSLFVLLAALGAPLSAQAQVTAADGDAQRGKPLAYTCNGCHAIPNYKNVYPTYSVPKLRGQRPEYLFVALKAYKSGERSHGTMHSHAASLNDQDMADIAAYLAGPTIFTESKNEDPVNPPKALATCRACHGTNGVGIIADYPTISGQHRDYLERALIDYQRGGRKNAIMAGMVQSLTRQDISELSAFYAARKPALETLATNNLPVAGK